MGGGKTIVRIVLLEKGGIFDDKVCVEVNNKLCNCKVIFLCIKKTKIIPTLSVS
jgi:hypothetical protein